MRRLSVALLLVAVAACTSSSPPVAPSPVTQTPVTPPPPPPPIVLTGRVVASVTGEALGGLSVLLADKTTTTDADGRFRYELPPGGIYPRLTISGPGIVQRSMSLSVQASKDLSIDVISTSSGFDLDFYRRFARDAYDEPGVLRPLLRWTQAPRIYVRTIDDNGEPVDAGTLETTIAALQDDAMAWTGGRFGLAGIETGTDSREGVSGWITVKWPADFEPEYCGRAQVAADGGWIVLYHHNNVCSCSSRTRISPGTVRHELGHAMGFFHTGDTQDLMNGIVGSCDGHASARERFHAALAYARPVGNRDIDDDPFSLFQRYRPSSPIVIVN
jgi:hypothetical protein